VYNYPYERDVALVDTNSYDTNDPGGTIALSAVTERASLKQHTMTSKVDPTGKTAVKSANGPSSRVLVPTTASSASDFPNTAYYNQFIAYLTTFVNYSNEPASETGTAANSDYNTLSDAIDYWDFSHDGNNYAESVTDIAAALAADPNLKFSILHGWDDFVCPETEALWDLENANLSKSVPIQTFEGGHMTYQTDSSRPELKSALDAFYRATRGSYFESDAKMAASAAR
jgi:carboxypeptidase C (cathepsin A)